MHATTPVDGGTGRPITRSGVAALLFAASALVCGCQKSAAVRWSDEPLPDEANEIESGFALSAAITSATLFNGEEAGTTSTLGACTATVIRSKSLSGVKVSSE